MKKDSSPQTAVVCSALFRSYRRGSRRDRAGLCRRHCPARARTIGLRNARQHIERRAPVHQADARIEQRGARRRAAPDLRHTTIHAKQTIDGFHRCAHRIFRREDGVARRLGELTEEGGVDGTIRNDIRAIALARGMKNAVMYGISLARRQRSHAPAEEYPPQARRDDKAILR